MLVLSFLVVVLVVTSRTLPKDYVNIYIGVALALGVFDFFIIKKIMNNRNKQVDNSKPHKDKENNGNISNASSKDEDTQLLSSNEENYNGMGTAILTMNKKEMHNHKSTYDESNVFESNQFSGTVILFGADAKEEVEDKHIPKLPYLTGTKDGIDKNVYINKETFKIGKSYKSADFVCDEKGVSRLHAEILLENGIYYLKDLQSTNGTYLNNEKVIGNKKHILKNGDCISFATKKYIFNMPIDEGSVSNTIARQTYSTGTEILFSKEDKTEILTNSKVPFLINNDIGIASKVEINKTPFVIGKIEGQVDYLCNNKNVSRRHAEILCENNQYYIIDLNSKNGTYINNNQIRSNVKYPIGNGDEIVLANQKFTFEI